jgi:3-methylfumaryl-CoA hydratase
MSEPTYTIDATTLKHLHSWVGRTETASDTITLAPMRALSATLESTDAEPAVGAALPPLWHWLYFLPHAPHSEIGADGHAKRGGFLPPVPLPRRMWAGGRFNWQANNTLSAGEAVQRVSTIKSVTHKTGRSGDLVFVVVQHALHNARGLALTEEHDIVYRAPAQPNDAVPTPIAVDTPADWHRDVAADPVLLFRYSALTFNGHRIHYDRSYVTETEGYPGLVVHGPLIATLLVDLIRRQLPKARLLSFDFRAVRPTFDGNTFRLNAQLSVNDKSVTLWAQDHDGWLTMQGSATLA